MTSVIGLLGLTDFSHRWLLVCDFQKFIMFDHTVFVHPQHDDGDDQGTGQHSPRTSNYGSPGPQASSSSDVNRKPSDGKLDVRHLSLFLVIKFSFISRIRNNPWSQKRNSKLFFHFQWQKLMTVWGNYIQLGKNCGIWCAKTRMLSVFWSCCLSYLCSWNFSRNTFLVLIL